MKPRVLFIVPDLGAGGAQPMNVRLAQQLRRRGWAVGLAVLFRRPEVITPDALRGLEVFRLNATGLPSKLAALVRLSNRAKNYDLVVGGVEFAATNYGFVAAWLAGEPFLCWTHIDIARHQSCARALDRAISHWVYRHCRYVVFPSNGALESLHRLLGLKSYGSRWRVIENFIEQSFMAGEDQPPDAKAFAKPVIMAIGRLAQQKAFDRLIRTHAALRQQGFDHHLVILGEGSLREELSNQAAALGVADTVFMPGHVPNVAAWLNQATVFVLCSRYEGFSLVLLEALACGIPAVAMDCPAGPREILDGGRCGILVPDGDETAMTEAIARLLRDPNLRVHYAALGRERAEHYSAERIVPQWEALFQEIIDEHRKSHG